MRVIKDKGEPHFRDTFRDGITAGMREPHPDLEDSPDWTPAPGGSTAPESEHTLAELNAIYATVSIAGKFRVMTYIPHGEFSQQRVVVFSTKTDFLNHVVTPKITVVEKTEDGASRETKRPRGKWWIEHPEHRRFDDIDFLPGGPNPIEINDARVPGRIIRKANMWAGFSIKPAKGDCSLYLNHVRDHVCQGNETLYDYTLAWMASGIQFPKNPARTALSMRGKPGAGKGIFAREYGKIF